MVFSDSLEVKGWRFFFFTIFAAFRVVVIHGKVTNSHVLPGGSMR